MTLKIQSFIYCFDGIEEANSYLKQKLNIDATKHIIHDAEGDKHIVYMYFPGHKANMNNPIVREAHGLILYEDGSLLTKLHNHPLVVEYIDLKGKHINEFQSVPDGRFMSVYNLEGKWRVATNTTPDGSDLMSVNRPGYYIGTEFMEHVGGQKRFETAHPDLIYVFNYVSHNNIQILPYTGRKAFLYTIIDRTTGKELGYDLVSKMAKNLDFDCTDNVVQTLTPGESCVDEDERYFIHNKIYVALKNALEAEEQASPTHMVKIYQACRNIRDLDVVCLTFPNYERMLDLIEELYQKLQTELTELWSAAHLYAEDPKRFADIVNHHPLKHILFKFKNGNTAGIPTELRKLRPYRILKLLEVYDKNRYKAYEKLIKLEKGKSLEKDTKQKEEGSEAYDHH